MTTTPHTQKVPSSKPIPSNDVARTHHVRSFFSGLLGVIAVLLIFISIIMVWLSRTIMNTAAFTSTIAPLSTQPAIQTYIAQQVDNSLIKNLSVQGIATTLSLPVQATGATDQELHMLVDPLIRQSVASIVSSQEFTKQWRSIVSSSHQEFMTQLQGNSNEIMVDFSAAPADIVADFKQTPLAPIADRMQLDPTIGKTTIKGKDVHNLRQAYVQSRRGVMGLVALTMLLLLACVALSVRRGKAVQRIAVTVSIYSFVAVALLSAGSLLAVSHDSAKNAAIRAVIQVVAHNLRMTFAVVGIVGVLITIGISVYRRRRHTTDVLDTMRANGL